MVNDLAHQASGFWSNQEKFGFLEKPNVPVCQTRQSDFQPVPSVTVYSAEPTSTKPDDPVSETVESKIFRITDESSEAMTADPDDWRTSLLRDLEKPGHIANRKVWRQALKYVMLDNTLYRQTIYALLIKCLGSNQSKIAMGEVHVGICGTHQSAHKMKWLLHCAGFY
jgi:hypothetical protein